MLLILFVPEYDPDPLEPLTLPIEAAVGGELAT
jgi:hypothetical protein